jgi:hypothetical protein
MSSLDQALQLAELGYRTFFCKLDKTPTTLHGFLNATADVGGVFDQWSLRPGPLVAIATGAGGVMEVDVVDVDVGKHLGARLWLHLNRSRLPPTRIHRTRSGGFHLFFRHRPGMRCSISHVAVGVDIRADGGYAVWWPYAECEVVSAAVPAPWPDWLAEMAGPRPRPIPVAREPGRRKRPLLELENSYGASALRRAREKILSASNGCQEQTIHREAFSIGTLIGAGILPHETAYETLVGIAGAVASLDPVRPWRHSEVAAKIRRGIELGIRHPRPQGN